MTAVVIEHVRGGAPPSTWDQTFGFRCVNGHSFELTADDYYEADFLLDRVECPCGAPATEAASSDDEVLCECPFCRESFWREPMAVRLETHRCYGGQDLDSYQVVGTMPHLSSLISDVWETTPRGAVQRERRRDFWNVVTHYTDARHFVEIMRSRVIKAHPTGFYGGRRPSRVRQLSKAVCMTETPWEFAAEIEDRFGAFGFAFEKAALTGIGCAPVLNIPKATLDRHRRAARDTDGLVYGWHPSLVPFINKIDTEFHYLHEREWRVPADIVFEKRRPWLLLPDSFQQQLAAQGVQRLELAEWLWSYGRAKTVGPGHPLAGDER